VLQSYKQAELWLRRRHGPQVIPNDGKGKQLKPAGEGRGLKLFLAVTPNAMKRYLTGADVLVREWLDRYNKEIVNVRN
jgi:hypothetical protein